MRMVFRSLTVIVLVTQLYSQNVTIKFASLAPEGSTWMNVMSEFSQALEDSTGGAVKFKIYPGGVAGDEMIVLRKIRVGQLHSGGFTGVGLGEILPEVRILDSPFLFRSHEEVDHVTAELFDFFAGRFEEKGFVLLGWAEVGFVYIFTNDPVRGLEDMDGIKMWMWEGDPIAQAAFESMDIKPIPLSITDVLTSLQTNLINGVYVSPLACVALQWHTRVKYMLDLPLANSNGAVLLSQKQYAKISDENRTILRRLGKRYFDRLGDMSRKDNKKSLELIRSAGIGFTEIEDKSQIENFYRAGRKARESLIGRLYDAELLNRVEEMLVEFREGE